MLELINYYEFQFLYFFHSFYFQIMLSCNEEYFYRSKICDATDNVTCMGCQHYSFDEKINLPYWMAIHILQVFVVALSSLVGLGAEIQKTSILMALLHYNEYEATNITYYVSIVSSSIYLLFLYCQNEIDLIDVQAAQLFFPFIVIFTDLGNYFNRAFYDQIIVLITIGLEYIWIILLTLKYDRSRSHEIESKRKEITWDENLINNPQRTQSYLSLIQQPTNEKNLKCALMEIVVLQFFLQLLLLVLRGGNKLQLITFEYSGLWYWISTISIYILGTLILCYLYSKQANDYQQHMHNDPNFYQIRPLNQSLLLISIALISFFFSGTAGVGAGLILIPCCILIQRFRMGILKAIRTMIFVQFLIDLCVIGQTLENYNSVQIKDQLFYMAIGFVSSIFTIILHIKFKKEQSQLILIIFIIGLFAFDFTLGIYQAYTFKSPIKGNPYFSISIDDCSVDCQFQE
ncbi:unnamed protein product [Paramecium octaurelia]|uniref:Uncharacterized protein n=1 Tax=Paramecium octaurelia TaxID=43137 RepID=A0A8S1SZI0_PAROT|nr:unnamed protein product [Paramecium octaurelia]